MTDYAAISYLAVLVAAIAGFALGGLWYSPAMFLSVWMKALGKKKEELCGSSTAKPMAVTALTTLVTAYVLSLFIHGIGATNLMGGLLTGLSVGIGFVATSMLSDYLFCNFSIRLFLIQAGFRVVSLTLMGAILGAWH